MNRLLAIRFINMIDYISKFIAWYIPRLFFMSIYLIPAYLISDTTKSSNIIILIVTALWLVLTLPILIEIDNKFTNWYWGKINK